MNFDQIEARIMDLKGLRTKSQIAELLGFSLESMGNKRKTEMLAKDILQWALNENVSLDLIFYGSAPATPISVKAGATEDRMDKEVLLQLLENNRKIGSLIDAIHGLTEEIARHPQVGATTAKIKR